MRADIPKAGTQAAKARRRATFDMAVPPLAQQQVIARIFAIGERAFGDAWKSPLARAISEQTGRAIAPTQIMSWLRGDRPVPEAVVEILPRLAMQLAEDLERRAKILRDLI